MDKLIGVRQKNAELIGRELGKYDKFSFVDFNVLSNPNRFPLIVKDLELKKKLEEHLPKKGIEVSDMYNKTMPYVYNMGYNKENLPNADYFSDHILTLPVHPLVKEKDLIYMINEIKKCFL